ncbi:MAG: rhodanese-like domain-containing protein, partial [Bacteroidales bacterium]|nr:rhodanese-like domain-containing protein [Bacteroidales bacterium]
MHFRRRQKYPKIPRALAVRRAGCLRLLSGRILRRIWLCRTFATRIAEPDVVLLDVRTAEEYVDGHIQGAINIDVKKDDFVEKAKLILPTDK